MNCVAVNHYHRVLQKIKEKEDKLPGIILDELSRSTSMNGEIDFGRYLTESDVRIIAETFSSCNAPPLRYRLKYISRRIAVPKGYEPVVEYELFKEKE